MDLLNKQIHRAKTSDIHVGDVKTTAHKWSFQNLQVKFQAPGTGTWIEIMFGSRLTNKTCPYDLLHLKDMQIGMHASASLNKGLLVFTLRFQTTVNYESFLLTQNANIRKTSTRYHHCQPIVHGVRSAEASVQSRLHMISICLAIPDAKWVCDRLRLIDGYEHSINWAFSHWSYDDHCETYIIRLVYPKETLHWWSTSDVNQNKNITIYGVYALRHFILSFNSHQFPYRPSKSMTDVPMTLTQFISLALENKSKGVRICFRV